VSPRDREDLALAFGRNLLRARRRASLSQEEVTIRAGLHRTEVSQLERGHRVPRIDTLVKLAGALEVPPGELLEGISWLPGHLAEGAFSLSPILSSSPPPVDQGSECRQEEPGGRTG
jgi:transcriptional regulator with XRE-family HTH domain